MPNKNTISFKLKISQKELEQVVLRVLQSENQIEGKAIQYFTEMQKVGNSYFMEFVIPEPLDGKEEVG